MSFSEYIIPAIALINIIILLFVIFRSGSGGDLGRLEKGLYRLEESLRLEQKSNREEISVTLRENRQEMSQALVEFRKELSETLKYLTEQNRQDTRQMRESIEKAFQNFQEIFDKNVHSFNELQREKFAQLDKKQSLLVESTEKSLERMRETVDEKLQKTLNERISHSFEVVNKQLASVQKGLGEMQTLAQDVGGLKRVLSNVKARGIMGEIQLANILEQILAPEQYQSNVRTKKGSSDHVEFALKLPGKDEEIGEIFLPIDSKFPVESYRKLQEAYDMALPEEVELASKLLEQDIKRCAKDIRDKYIDPPYTTDFAILFLPFESLYAEVVRKTSLIETLQRDYKIVVTGPTTLAAMLNSLQMGFRTLAIQKRSSEVWQILGAVKTEFGNFSGMLQKAKTNLDTASNHLDKVLGVRTRAIEKKLKNVQELPSEDSVKLLDLDDQDEV